MFVPVVIVLIITGKLLHAMLNNVWKFSHMQSFQNCIWY